MKFFKLHSDPHNLVLVIGSSTLYEVSVVSFLVTYARLIMVVLWLVFLLLILDSISAIYTILSMRKIYVHCA